MERPVASDVVRKLAKDELVVSSKFSAFCMHCFSFYSVISISAISFIVLQSKMKM